MKVNWLAVGVGGVLWLGSAAGQAMAGPSPITQIGQFAGGEAESFESFQHYNEDANFYMDDPTAIFGGSATIGSSDSLLIWDMIDADWSLVDSGDAQAVDGTQGFGLDQNFDESFDTVIIDFLNDDVLQFGGWFGAVTGAGAGFPDPAPITFTFYDAGGSLLDTIVVLYSHSSTDDGLLDWHGFESAVPLGSVGITGTYFVMDSLQKNVPGPGGLALLGGAALLRSGRRRRG
jgi:hypothetical protein